MGSATSRAGGWMAPSLLRELDSVAEPQSIEYDVDGTKMTVMVIRTAAALAAYESALNELSEAAIEPNAFYEPWMLFPALGIFGDGLAFFFVLIFAHNSAQRNQAPQLCGFFPLHRERGFRRLPVSSLRMWKHKYCYLCTPLMRADHTSKTFSALFRWLEKGEHKCAVIEFQHVSGDGSFQKELDNYIWLARKPYYNVESHARAILHPSLDPDKSGHTLFSGKLNSRIRQNERGLAKVGQFKYDVLEPDGDLGQWIDEFLKLEASGWKGREGSALGSTPQGVAYFKTIASEAFRRGQLIMTALRLDERAIAQRCSFRSQAGAFTFKIAFDETYSSHSPGLLLEAHNVKYIQLRSDIRWMDSCTSPDNAMFNRLWKDRRLIRSVAMSIGSRMGYLSISIARVLRWLKRTLSSQKIGDESMSGIVRES